MTSIVVAQPSPAHAAVVAAPSSPQRLLDIDVVRGRAGNVCRQTIYNMVNRGEFPAPIKFGRRSLWLESEFEQWIASRAAARRSA
jgi:predicted DNA-binding transcriptional regulator AlpA